MKIRKPRITTRTNLSGSISYCVDAGKHQGKRLRKFFRTKRDAENHARTLQESHQRYGELALRLTAEQQVEAAKAYDLLAPHKLRLLDVIEGYLLRNCPKNGKITCQKLAAEVLTSKQANGKKPKYLKALRSAFSRFNETFGQRLAHEITPAEIESWLHALTVPKRDPEAPKQLVSALTRRNYLRDLGILFNFGINRGYLADNPTSKIEAPQINEKDIEILTPEQAAMLMWSALNQSEVTSRKNPGVKANLVPYVALGLFAGLRSSEIEAMDWKHIDLARRTIEVTANVAKTSRRRTVNISDNLYAWLLPHHQEAGSLVFTGWRDRLQKLSKAAGLEQWPRNALRHSFASYHFQRSGNVHETTSQTGHDETRTFHRHYKQLVTEDATNRFWNIFPPQPGQEWMMTTPKADLTKAERAKCLRQLEDAKPERKERIVVTIPASDDAFEQGEPDEKAAA